MICTTRHSFPRLFITLLALSLLLAATACTGSSTQTRDDQAGMQNADHQRAQVLFVHANEALDQGNWELAIRLYDDALTLHPRRWDLHMNRGIALTRMERFRDATDAFAQALETGGDREPELYFNLGALYQERGLYEHSIDAYRTSLAYRGELEYETLLNIAAAYTFVHSYPEARQTIERAIELNPDDPRGYLSLGLITYSEENPDEALRIYDDLIANYPDFASAHFNRGFVLMRIGQPHEAIEAFQTYLQLDPSGPYTRQAENNISTIQRRL